MMADAQSIGHKDHVTANTRVGCHYFVRATALKLIDRIEDLVPPPLTHRHLCFGVLTAAYPLKGLGTLVVHIWLWVRHCCTWQD